MVSEKKIDIQLDNARDSSEINETDISLLTWLVYTMIEPILGTDQTKD